jgi:hypothetical protein
MIQSFVPTFPIGLYEWYLVEGQKRGLTRGQLQKGYNAWLYGHRTCSPREPMMRRCSWSTPLP